MEGGNRGGNVKTFTRNERFRSNSCLSSCDFRWWNNLTMIHKWQEKISSMGIPCFACNPEKLPLLLERVLKGLDLNSFQEEFKKNKIFYYIIPWLSKYFTI